MAKLHGLERNCSTRRRIRWESCSTLSSPKYNLSWQFLAYFLPGTHCAIDHDLMYILAETPKNYSLSAEAISRRLTWANPKIDQHSHAGVSGLRSSSPMCFLDCILDIRWLRSSWKSRDSVGNSENRVQLVPLSLPSNSATKPRLEVKLERLNSYIEST